MVSLRRPDPSQSAGQMSFPGNRPGVRHYTVKNPAETNEHEQRHDRRSPTLHQKAGNDEIGDESENDRTGADMDNGTPVVRSPPDQPGAQSAEKPDRGERHDWIIVPVPEQQNEQDEQRQ